jgi:hypothetical protein
MENPLRGHGLKRVPERPLTRLSQLLGISSDGVTAWPYNILVRCYSILPPPKIIVDSLICHAIARGTLGNASAMI